jgi:hypothetical protein
MGHSYINNITAKAIKILGFLEINQEERKDWFNDDFGKFRKQCR